MKNNRILFLTSVLCFSLLATGCGEALYSMTSEEEAIIALYASKTVCKFNKNQTIGIANARVRTGELDDTGTDETEEEQSEEATEETEVTIDPETGEEIVSKQVEEEDATEETDDSSSDDTGYSFTSAVDIDGVDFTCSEFDVTGEYKASSSFILTQVSGKKYLILYIDAENTSGESVDFSTYSNRQYSLSLNGGEKSNSQYTPLSNDLSNFDGKLAAGETKSFILVFLFSNSSVENISSLELYVTSDGTTRGTSI